MHEIEFYARKIIYGQEYAKMYTWITYILQVYHSIMQMNNAIFVLRTIMRKISISCMTSNVKIKFYAFQTIDNIEFHVH